MEKQKKDAQYHSESLKYWNRETTYTRGKARIARGLSRAKSDNYSRALYALGQGRRAMAGLEQDRAALQSAKGAISQSGESRSAAYGRNARAKILAKQAAIESSIDTTFGQNMAGNNQKITRQYQRQVAKNRDALGVTPEYGMPVMMPPKGNRTMANLQFGLGIISTAAPFFMASDIKLKENIKEIGKSPKGYKIYEWNYKSNKNTRYRGVIAQDVVKINPMAVGIMPNGYLGVYYDKVDVNMEVLS